MLNKHLEGGELAARLRELLARLEPLLGFKIKVAEIQLVEWEKRFYHLQAGVVPVARLEDSRVLKCYGQIGGFQGPNILQHILYIYCKVAMLHAML